MSFSNGKFKYAEFCKTEKIRCVQNIKPNTSRRDVTRGVSSDWLVVMLIASSFSFPTPVKKDIDHGNEVISGQRQENKMADEPW